MKEVDGWEEGDKVKTVSYDKVIPLLVEAIKELNRLLTQPIPSTGDEDTGETAGDEGGEADAGGADTEMEPEEPAEEPEA